MSQNREIRENSQHTMFETFHNKLVCMILQSCYENMTSSLIERLVFATQPTLGRSNALAIEIPFSPTRIWYMSGMPMQCRPQPPTVDTANTAQPMATTQLLLLLSHTYSVLLLLVPALRLITTARYWYADCTKQ